MMSYFKLTAFAHKGAKTFNIHSENFRWAFKVTNESKTETGTDSGIYFGGLDMFVSLRLPKCIYSSLGGNLCN